MKVMTAGMEDLLRDPEQHHHQKRMLLLVISQQVGCMKLSLMFTGQMNFRTGPDGGRVLVIFSALSATEALGDNVQETMGQSILSF